MSVCISILPEKPVSLEVVRGSSLGERVRRRLTQSPYHAVRRVSVEERQGVLTLSGRLPNYYLKQMAQTAVAKVEGVTSIINRIDVVEPRY
jgi:osmotically-inducible protein OsmY